MNLKIIWCIFLLISISMASALISLPSYPSTLPDGTNLSNISTPSNDYNITGLIAYMQSTGTTYNNLYFKTIVPEDEGDGWNLSKELMERKPTVILFPYPPNSTTNNYSDAPTTLSSWVGNEIALAFVCCNISKGDLLYTANATNENGQFNITLAGTLVNNKGQNWKSRVYNSTTSSWGNVNIGASQIPDIYNRRAILHSDGVIVGYAVESVNVTVPTLIKIYKV